MSSHHAFNNPAFHLVGDHEDAVVESLEDLRPDGGKTARITLRLSPRLVGYLQAVADANNRSLAAECNAALCAHETLHRLSLVLDQDEQMARKAATGGTHGVTGASAVRFAEMLRDDLAEIWAASFRPAHRVYERDFPRWLVAEPVEQMAEPERPVD